MPIYHYTPVNALSTSLLDQDLFELGACPKFTQARENSVPHLKLQAPQLQTPNLPLQRSFTFTMRLRLQIFRNGLPVVKLIWETTARLQPGTDEIVSNLLASVNEIFPLEGSTIGLEEYVVELDGFEVLHFQELSTVFKNDDTVTYV